MTFYAHSNGTKKDEWQLLKTHLENTAKIARSFSDERFAEIAYLAGLIHDLGKYSLEFQKRLEGCGKKVDHSTAGAKEVLKYFNQYANQKIIGEILAFCIAGHHAGLPDYGSPIDTEEAGTLQARLKKNIANMDAYKFEIDFSQLPIPNKIPIIPTTASAGFSLSFFTRMIYSLLVDADFLETESIFINNYPKRANFPTINELQGSLGKFLTKFNNPENEIHQNRTKTLNTCLSKATEPPGIFSLTVPTGGGKTYSSLAFALKHAVLHGMKRIIYVIPYTTIIEQTAGLFKEALGEPFILEHHSNFEWDTNRKNDAEEADDQTNLALSKIKLASENWDIPIIVTTNVQFFESLFANKSSRSRKVHNIAQSVIIFDEAQMLPREFLKPCLAAVYELTQNYRTTALICTATQPPIQRFFPKEGVINELTEDPKALYETYKRVEVNYCGKLSDTDLIDTIQDKTQALCIVNTRKHAKGLFEMLEPKGRYHLSTLMYPAHRKKVVETIRERLKQGMPCRVISTQIMEAGIDVDFPTGFRALAGLDSIIQAAGRVNRERKNPKGTLTVFEPNSLFVGRTPAYIAQAAEVALAILRKYQNQDPISLDAIHDYYEQLYEIQDKNAFDVNNIMGCFEKNLPTEPCHFDFRTAAEKFRLIDNNTVSVIIPIEEEVQKILVKIKNHPYPLSFSRKLQRFTVNIYPNEYQALLANGCIEIIAETFAVLKNSKDYNQETGLLIPESSTGLALFFDG